MAFRVRFGVLAAGREDPSTWRQLVRAADAIGYSSIQVPQHFSLPSAPPMLALALAAEYSDRLKLGTLVLDAGLVHPAIVAKEASWLAGLSDGRLELGIGAGWMSADHEVLGRTWPSAGQRVAQLEDALTVIRQCLTDEPASTNGAHYRVEGLANGSRCPTVTMPILVGGGGPKVLDLAARWADIVSIAPTMSAGRIDSQSARTSTNASFAGKVAHVKAAAGERASSIELHTTITNVVRPGERARLQRIALSFGVDEDDVERLPTVLAGTDQGIVEELERRHETLGISYFSVPSSFMRDLETVVAVFNA